MYYFQWKIKLKIRMNQIFVEQEKLNQELQTLKEDIIREDGKVKALKNIWDTEIHGESNFDVVKEKAAKAKVLGG